MKGILWLILIALSIVCWISAFLTEYTPSLLKYFLNNIGSTLTVREVDHINSVIFGICIIISFVLYKCFK